MRYRTRLTAILVVEGFLLLILVGGLFFAPHSPLARRARPLIRNFDGNTVEMIEITPLAADAPLQVRRIAADETITATAIESEWGFIVGDNILPADDANITALLDAVGDTRQVRFVTDNTDRFDELGLSADNVIRLALYDDEGESIADFAIGGTAPQNTRYLRRTDTDDVHAVSSGMIFYLEQDAGYWQHTRLLPDDISAPDVTAYSLVADVQLTGSDERLVDSYRLYRQTTDQNTTEWVSVRPAERPLDQSNIDNLINSTIGLEGASFAVDYRHDPDAIYDESATITIELATQQTYALRIFGNSDSAGEYYIQPVGDNAQVNVSGAPYYYLINDWALRPVIESFDDLYAPIETESP